MTDLEKLWDDLPTGRPPVEAILRAARNRRNRRRILIQPVIAMAATTALIAAFVVGLLVGGRTPTTFDQPQSGPSPVAFQADLDPAQNCDQLLASYRDRGLSLVSAWGWGPGFDGYLLGPATASSDQAMPLSGMFGSSAGREQAASPTGTNVQEDGVDEPDIVKTDGSQVVRLRGDDLVVYDAAGASMQKLSTINLPRFVDGEILLVGDTVVAIGTDQVSSPDTMTGLRRGSRVVTVSLSEPSSPTIESTVTYSSRVISARQHDSVVRLVLAAGLPALDFIQPDGKSVTKDEALAANRLAIEMSTIGDWLPSYDPGTGSEQLLDCTNVAIPPEELGLDTVSIVGFSATSATTPHAIGVSGPATIAYASADHLYLATGPPQWDCRMCPIAGPRASGYAASGTTYLYDFELDGVNAVHVASGEVEGTIADRWSIDEADNILRVAVGPSSETGNFNSVVTFRRTGHQLVELGRLDKLGANEDLKGVRWFDDLAVVVTYREVDPLFTIDLADPEHPRLIGKLKIPGYSDYLHPISDEEMLGIGYGGSGDSWGAQVALFDISDLAHVRRTDVAHYRGADALATWEPRSFTWLPDHETALTVLQKGRKVKIAALTVAAGQLSSTLSTVDYGDDAAQVRTLGLPDGRVVLVTGEEVRFFDLP